MSFTTIAVAVAHGVCRVTLNRPAQRNAMSLAMVMELRAALDGALADEAVRLMVLRGAGGNFCSGGDISDMAAARGAVVDGVDPIATMNAKFGFLCAAFAESAKPVVAVLEGAVIGGGFGLACVADVAVAHAGAKFRLSETSLGLVPAQIAPFLVARLSFSTANRLALTASTLTGAQALAVGLVHELAEDDAALEACVENVLQALKKSPPGALAATKSLVRRAAWERPETLIEEAARIFARSARSREGEEGMMAFLQKRAPYWVDAG
jgi:isohexenylglutaconyl-CoA hydratase